jgi:hypothetical protein
LDYGFDYKKSCAAGLTTLCLEAMEEVTGRRFQGTQGWESIGICNVATTKALVPDINILWTSSTCNCPEHWHTLRDQPNIIERECLALGSTTFVDNSGATKRAFDGALTIFGIDLTATEWRWLKERVDLGFGFEVESNLGPTVLWSDNVFYEHAKRGVRWPISATVAKMRFAGIPIQSAATIENVPKARKSSYLLVDPLGIADDEVAILDEAISDGAVLIVAGDVENEKLLDLLGIEKTGKSATAKKWKLSPDGSKLVTAAGSQGMSEDDLHGYRTVKAISMADACTDDGKVSGTAVATHFHGKGKCVFIRRAYTSMPSLSMELTAEEKRGTPRVHGNQEPALKSIREVMENIAKVHPDELDLIAAASIQAADKSLPRCDKGQLLGFKGTDGFDYLLLENAANLMYSTIHVKLPRNKESLSEFSIKPIGPVGYVFFGDSNEDSFDVCVPPDAGIPVKIRYKKE